MMNAGKVGDKNKTGEFIWALGMKIKDTADDGDDPEYQKCANEAFVALRDIVVALNKNEIGASEASIIARSIAFEFFNGPLRSYIAKNHPTFLVRSSNISIGRA